MAKSYRNCYYRNHKEFSQPERTLWRATSNKENKTLSHRMARAKAAVRLHKELLQLGWRK